MLPKLDFVSTTAGSFMVFTTDTVIPQCLRTYGGFEPHLLQIATEIFRRRGRPGVLVDAGAYIGTFSVPVSLATGCSIVAFEAQRVVAQLLGANFLINGIDRATIKNVILAGPEHPRVTPIPAVDYSKTGNFGAYSLDTQLFNRESLARMTSSGRVETVEVRALDEFDLNDVFLMKLDVEGQELEVLRGAVRTLERNGFPPLLFEAWRDVWWQDKKTELLGFVQELGYEVTAMDENFLAQHRTALQPLQIQPTSPVVGASSA